MSNHDLILQLRQWANACDEGLVLPASQVTDLSAVELLRQAADAIEAGNPFDGYPPAEEVWGRSHVIDDEFLSELRLAATRRWPTVQRVDFDQLEAILLALREWWQKQTQEQSRAHVVREKAVRIHADAQDCTLDAVCAIMEAMEG